MECCGLAKPTTSYYDKKQTAITQKIHNCTKTVLEMHGASGRI